MKLRIAIWAAAGALVVVCWSFYFSATHHTPAWMGWTLVDLTMPIALVRHYHVAMSVNIVLLVNAATYALVGTAAESMWQHYKHRHQATAH
jgi:hypothetical protein